MNGSIRPALPRRLILGGALLLALVVSLPPRAPMALAQSETPGAKSASSSTSATPTGAPAAASAPAVEAPTTSKESNDTRSTDQPGIVVEQGGKKVRVLGAGRERNYDDFGHFVRDEGALAGMAVAIVFIVFLAPVLIVALIVGYRIRKARMLNETMLKLAERGIVTSDAVIHSLASGDSSAATGAIPAEVTTAAAGLTPMVHQAQQLRQRAAASDLRKGVILGALGLAFTFYSMLDDGSPNVVGLILLFLGIGYGVLWWFEHKQDDGRPRTAGIPGDGA